MIHERAYLEKEKGQQIKCTPESKIFQKCQRVKLCEVSVQQVSIPDSTGGTPLKECRHLVHGIDGTHVDCIDSLKMHVNPPEVETSEHEPFGTVAIKGQGCFGCNRPDHTIATCPYGKKCRQCLKELNGNGYFANNPKYIRDYRHCGKKGHGPKWKPSRSKLHC